MSIKNIIEVKNLSYAYDTNVVLKDVSFSIAEGDYVGIIGPNGGGKTTLIKMLVGLLVPQNGTVSIVGNSAGTRQSALHLGYVPQRLAEDNVSFPATVYEIVGSGRLAGRGLFSRLSGVDKSAINHALAVANISDLKDRLMSTLSGGQRQRVYIARALAGEPDVLILDEPFTGVDTATQRDFFSFLKKLNTEHGLTIVLVSHDIDMVTTEAKSILCLNQGLLCFGDKSQIDHDDLLEKMYGKSVMHLHHI